MNATTLSELFNRYEANIEMLYDKDHDEVFKWRAMKTFQREWFSKDHPDFISRFNAATKDFDILIDNSIMHPTNGAIKLYEKEPLEVERLFCNVLFADDNGDLNLRQKNMEAFIDGMEKLREKYFPTNWSYKQDRHTASTFLAMFSPDDNYIYKYSEAEAMAVYGEFGFDIGSGADFNLQYYYKMCDEIVEQLKSSSLLKTHLEKLNDSCYGDQSYHLLAFNVIYCCHAYGFYKGLSHISKKDSIKQAVEAAKEKAAAELTQQKIESLINQIEELELSLPDVSDISLANVEVASQNYGVGIITEHKVNRIKVQFNDLTKDFILDKKYPARPTFENDEEVVEMYSEFASISKEIDSLKSQLNKLMGKQE